jgi:predicted RNA binding protein YcfA (HicA-like mRNA interferase family)
VLRGGIKDHLLDSVGFGEALHLLPFVHVVRKGSHERLKHLCKMLCIVSGFFGCAL